MKNRRLWLIDAGYLLYTQSSVRQDYNFDYLKLRNKLEEHGALWHAYYCNSVDSNANERQDSFHSWLQTALPNGPQIITKLYPTRTGALSKGYCNTCRQICTPSCPDCGEKHLSITRQKGVDVGLTTLALTLVEHYDTLVLSSGDGDLVDMIDFLILKGKNIELLVFRQDVSTDLLCRANVIHYINDFAEAVAKH